MLIKCRMYNGPMATIVIIEHVQWPSQIKVENVAFQLAAPTPHFYECWLLARAVSRQLSLSLCMVTSNQGINSLGK